MGTMKIRLTADRRASDFDNIHRLDKRDAARRISQILDELASGSQSGEIELESGTSQAKASGTFTFDTVVATDVLSINGVDFTAVASGATGNQFNVGGNDTVTAANAAAAINASSSALVSEHVTASSSGAVVTITADEYGDEGDAITISSPDATITASGARLTGGEDDQVTTFTYG